MWRILYGVAKKTSGQIWRVCFPDRTLSKPQVGDLYPPENLPDFSGKHSGECEDLKFSPRRKLHKLSSNLRPETKKPTSGLVGGESKKMVEVNRNHSYASLLRSVSSDMPEKIREIAFLCCSANAVCQRYSKQKL